MSAETQKYDIPATLNSAQPTTPPLFGADAPRSADHTRSYSRMSELGGAWRTG